MTNIMSGSNDRYSAWRRVAGALVASAALAAAVTWLGAAYDQPIDAAVIAGMRSPHCQAVRDMPPGSLLIAAQPEDGVCRAFFLYRGAIGNEAADERGYKDAVQAGRLREFEQLVGYVFVLVSAVTLSAIAMAAVVRTLWRRLRMVGESFSR
ncbi:hypothetical protein [Burkholderia singularis]|uniref:Transmembrane protein n=1 Tax=Burkholderia singularis TaxID=1503053 RepID=A0A238H3N3_9BURK|nr:hypothetical protein [Burkholderia singularis]SMF99931.1 hypothetical protein BSIN_3119 [Burkholderia singularis]